MKYNYPIKYTAMPIIEQVGWTHGLNELEREYDVVCYIVSKCYLISDKTIYKDNGKNDKIYEVVFPYQNGNYDWKRNVPLFNLINKECTNSDFVEKVFDNYEDALEFATQKNKKICEKTWSCLPYSKDLHTKILEKIEKFNDKLSEYKMLEQQILFNTTDLEHSKTKELDKVIVIYDQKIKTLSSNLYDYLKNPSKNIIVYSISLEQYNKLIATIDTKSISEIIKIKENANPILYYTDSVNDNILVINNDGKVLYYIDENKRLRNNEIQMSPVNLEEKIPTEIYTTETLEDIILSFSAHKLIDPTQIQGPVLKKNYIDYK